MKLFENKRAIGFTCALIFFKFDKHPVDAEMKAYTLVYLAAFYSIIFYAAAGVRHWLFWVTVFFGGGEGGLHRTIPNDPLIYTQELFARPPRLSL